jgi:hypothetical protein
LLTGGLEELKTLLSQANQQIEIANRIIKELSREGIFLPSLNQIPVKDDYMSIYSGLKTAVERLKTIRAFYSKIE